MSSSRKKLSKFEFLFSWQNRTFLLTENSAEELVQLASTFSQQLLEFSQHLLNFCFDVLSSSFKGRENSNLLKLSEPVTDHVTRKIGPLYFKVSSPVSNMILWIFAWIFAWFYPKISACCSLRNLG